MENTHSKVLDQHRWPKVSVGSLNRIMDLMDKSRNSTCSPVQGRGVSPLRRPPSSLQKSQSEVASQITFDQSGRIQYEKYVGASSCSSERSSSTTRTTRSQPMSFVPGSPRTPSPSKASPYREFRILENIIYSIWNTTFELWDFFVIKRINLQQLRQELKLSIVLNEQIAYLDDWALLEKEHLTSISGDTEALEACTLRLPVTSEARADMDTLKKAICSVVDVMQTMVYEILYAHN
ncbi:hypothetical protein GIB67_012155 [Kingdonia uniflora]|uniref:Uncharacterized protein n=1 Tax=Kingdonia uniflora TaxID=39325 RepID=A0A7J7NNF6_9MAGN|nr:hypothetical protein GIB67_012155 [Kingdonia uniflora]